MTLDFTNLNWLAVIAAAAAVTVLGFVLYLPQVLGRRWAAAAGIELPGAGDENMLAYIGAVIQALVVAYVLAVLMAGLGAASIVDGLIVGFLAWLGFIGITSLDSVLFEKRSWEYWLITSGFRLLSLLLMGGIIGYLGA